MYSNWFPVNSAEFPKEQQTFAKCEPGCYGQMCNGDDYDWMLSSRHLSAKPRSIKRGELEDRHPLLKRKQKKTYS